MTSYSYLSKWKNQLIGSAMGTLVFASAVVAGQGYGTGMSHRPQ